MAKSKLEKLQDAIAAGDLETAKRLTTELQKAAPKKKATAKGAAKKTQKPPNGAEKPKAAPKKTATKKKTAPKKVTAKPQVEQDGVVSITSNMSAKARRPIGDPDKKYAEFQPIAVNVKVADDDFDDIPETHKVIDNLGRQARRASENRPPHATVDVPCTSCGKPDKVSKELADGFAEDYHYRCNSCIR